MLLSIYCKRLRWRLHHPCYATGGCWWVSYWLFKAYFFACL